MEHLIHLVLYAPNNQLFFKKIKLISLIISLIVLSLTALLFAYNQIYDLRLNYKNNNSVSGNCITKTEKYLVRGNSLSGLIEPNQTIRIIFGFYDCNEIKRGDVVAHNYAGNPELIIKIAKGIPGDKFNLQKTTDGWHILINAEILKNSQNQPYILNENGYKMLSLYEVDYMGIIPANTYLILGNLISGSVDSSRFGLINKQGILGKVESAY